MEKAYYITEKEFNDSTARVLCYKFIFYYITPTKEEKGDITLAKVWEDYYDSILAVWKQYENEIKTSIDKDIVDEALKLLINLINDSNVFRSKRES